MSSINANNSTALSYTPNAEKPAKPAAKIEQEPVVAVTPLQQSKPEVAVSRTELQKAVDVVNQAVALEQRSLSFSIDDVSGRSVIKVVDFETDELIKQIPSEELLKVAQDIKRLQEEMGQSIGLLIDSKV
ncbi:flagellar protein FlaG [Rheinheimera sp. YQF-2]|uniref:Flagellar protein FlaG n=1 Tax=Rheinheimera lutimaris TaxID=2740584 RepID=A0A7Y5APV2_9GAMM|nr:flagellar protein FlaG [Rheinheimera lutimaris]NRQ42323.1 flagellar protein FlaG [Rheinheimera lutimaris]